MSPRRKKKKPCIYERNKKKKELRQPFIAVALSRCRRQSVHFIQIKKSTEDAKKGKKRRTDNCFFKQDRIRCAWEFQPDYA